MTSLMIIMIRPAKKSKHSFSQRNNFKCVWTARGVASRLGESYVFPASCNTDMVPSQIFSGDPPSVRHVSLSRDCTAPQESESAKSACVFEM
jgi:hypothetical protein